MTISCLDGEIWMVKFDNGAQLKITEAKLQECFFNDEYKNNHRKNDWFIEKVRSSRQWTRVPDGEHRESKILASSPHASSRTHVM